MFTGVMHEKVTRSANEERGREMNRTDEGEWFLGKWHPPFDRPSMRKREPKRCVEMDQCTRGGVGQRARAEGSSATNFHVVHRTVFFYMQSLHCCIWVYLDSLGCI